jgi:hypothetical protein
MACMAEHPAAGHPLVWSKFTWHGQVRSILERHCGACHGRSGVAMSFDRYEDARPWATAIKEEVLERRMPPWPAAPGYHALRSDPSLTAFEREMLLQWIGGGAPEGEPREMPPARALAGLKGDVILSLPPRGSAGTREIALRPDLGGRGWLSSWTVEIADGGGLVEVRLFSRQRLLGVWTPVSGRVALPACAGQAIELPLRVQLSYVKGAASSGSSGRLALRLMTAVPAVIAAFRPIGSRERLERDLTVFGVALMGGPEVELRAGYPDGRADVLGVFGPIRARKGDAPSAVDLRFVTPLELPRGSAIYRDGGALQLLVGSGPAPTNCVAAQVPVSEGEPPPPSRAP